MHQEQDQAHLQDINKKEPKRGADPVPSRRTESTDIMEAATSTKEARNSEIYLIY